MSRIERIGVAIFVIGAAAYFLVLLHNNCYFAAGPDSSGYCNEARLIASGHATREVKLMRTLGLPPDLIQVFTPLGFCQTSRPYHMAPTYPAGQPLHQVVLAAIGGWSRAPFLVGPGMALLSIIAMIALARIIGLPLLYSLAAGAILALIPVFVVHALTVASDDAATFYAIVPIAILLSTRRSPALSFLAGVFFAIGVWVRPTNLLVALPLVIAARWDWRRLIPTAAGAIPIGVALAGWQKTLYGNPFHTGYGTFSAVMTSKPACASTQLWSLVTMLTPVVVVGACFVFFVRGIDRWERVLLATWFGVFLLFYSFYYWCDGWLSARFLLPAVPALILAFLFVVRACVSLVGNRGHPLFAGILATLVIVSVVGAMIHKQLELGVYQAQVIDEVYPETVRFAEARLPKNAIVASGLLSGAFLYYADRETVRWDEAVLDRRLPRLRAAAKRAGLRWYAVESTVEVRPEQFDAWLPAIWVPVAINRDVTLWRLEE
jgi:hypothetical protein